MSKGMMQEKGEGVKNLWAFPSLDLFALREVVYVMVVSGEL